MTGAQPPRPRRGRSKAELATENRMLRRYGIGLAISNVLTTGIRWGGAAFIAWCGYRTVATLAGQATFAQIGIQFLADVRVSEAAAWIFGGGGAVYGMRQAKLRKDTVERLSGRIAELERRFDPRRSSSELTPRGEEPGP